MPFSRMIKPDKAFVPSMLVLVLTTCIQARNFNCVHRWFMPTDLGTTVATRGAQAHRKCRCSLVARGSGEKPQHRLSKT